MRVKFRRATRYSEDGHVVLLAGKNEARDVAHTAAVALVNSRVADPVIGKPDICNID